MQNKDSTLNRSRGRSLQRSLLLCVCCFVLNLLLSKLVLALRLPLFLDSVGTILAAVLGGYLPGIIVGYATNLAGSVSDPITAYYAVINVLIAVCAAWFARRGCFRKLLDARLLLSVLVFALMGGGLGSILTFLLYGMDFGSGFSAPLARQLFDAGLPTVFLSQLSSDLIFDLLDKAVSVLLGVLILKLLPERWFTLFRPDLWCQAPLTEEERAEALQRKTRGIGLRRRIILLVAAATLLIAVAAIGISALQYHRTTVEEHRKLGIGVAGVVAAHIDPERVEEYLREGESAEGYAEVERQLYAIRETSPDILYIYVYQILPDGCHVVFDLDTEDIPGGEPGELVAFDESFAELIPALLAGEPIEPMITDDTFGWLLTVYHPVYDRDGNCVCYAAADISMGQVKLNELSFLSRAVSLFLGLFILILALGLWLAEYGIILPVNSMAHAADAFAYNSEEARSGTLELISRLDIRTGDEIEDLYRALAKTTEDTVRYIADVQEKNETITHMQTGLILVLADMVESRDQCTGDHVRKTAAYVRIIMEQMKKEGIYGDRITDEYIEDVANSAPLHDVGKIQISDTLLNKPGKLTDEEYHRMQYHTVAGGEIISHAIALVTDAGYLAEAKNLASFHHERWDGKGYPSGLKGEEIPLSARIMAVADVFDALVSRRSYKAPFTFEKAVDIIREESGTHFDPEVVKAFLDAEPEVRRVAEQFHEE